MRNTWILVNGTRVYLDPEALARGSCSSPTPR